MKHFCNFVLFAAVLVLGYVVWDERKRATTNNSTPSSLTQTDDTITCYWCKESIKKAALICKHCGKNPDYGSPPREQVKANTSSRLTASHKKKKGTEKDGYKGRVKSVKKTEFQAGEKFGTVRYIRKYDEKGNRTESMWYNKGEIGGKSKYDEKGNRSESVEYDADGKIAYKLTSKYDEKGNETESVRYDADGKVISRDVTKYDQKTSRRFPSGNELESLEYDADGKIKVRRTYKYDDKGNLVESWTADADGNITGKSTYKYDEKGSCLEGAISNADGEIETKLIHRYGDMEAVGGVFQNKISTTYYYRRNGKLVKAYSTKLDGKGNDVERQVYDNDGTLLRRTVYKYDEKGNGLGWVEFVVQRLEPLRMTTYENDEKGNKVEEAEYDNKEFGLGKTRMVLEKKTTWEFTYWD